MTATELKTLFKQTRQAVEPEENVENWAIASSDLVAGAGGEVGQGSVGWGIGRSEAAVFVDCGVRASA